jgi:hypothetical protein
MTRQRISNLVRFGEWIPDEPDLNNEGSININNVLVQGDNYKPFKKFSSLTTSISTSARIYGAYSFVASDGVSYTFAGDESDLFRLVGSTWQNVTKASTNYNVQTEGQWRFTSFGDRVIATNLADNVQSYIAGTSTGFSDLSTSAPKFKDITVLNNFLIGIHVDDGNIRPNRVQWSALNNPTLFSNPTDNPASLSDFQDLEENGGFNQRIVTTQNYALIVREKSLVRMEFVGSPAIFTFTTAEENRGTNAVNSVVSDGTFVYYLNENGFFAFNGTSSIAIGDNKVDRYFLENLDTNLLYRVKAAIDPVEKLITWAYPNTNNTGNLNKVINFHYAENRWSQGDISLGLVETVVTSGVTLEQLSAQSTNLDLVPFSMDSRVWQGGSPVLAGFSTDLKLGYFDGQNNKAVLESAEVALNAGGRAFVSSVLPVTDAESITGVIKSRKNQNGTLTVSSSASYNTQTNEMSFRVDDRYHRYELTIAENSTWELVQGFRYRYRNSGIL